MSYSKKALITAMLLLGVGVLEYGEIRTYYYLKKFGAKRIDKIFDRHVRYEFPDGSEALIKKEIGTFTISTYCDPRTDAHQCIAKILETSSPTVWKVDM